MTEEVKVDSDALLNDAVNSFYDKEEVVEDKKEDLAKETIEEDNSEIEVKEDEADLEEPEEDSDSESESDEKEELEEKEINLTESLRGVFSKDYINLLESIDDPDLRNNLIEAGKKQRADLDRKRLELGESKKLVETFEKGLKNNNLNYNKQQYSQVIENYVNLDALFAKDPTLAIKTLAQQANIDLEKTFGSKSVQNSDDDYEDYRTPEEIKRDQEIEVLKQELNLIKNQKRQEEQLTVQQEIDSFANSRDEDGNLKYPYFDRLKTKMGLFFNDENPNMTLEKAYSKAMLLDDELISIRDQEILRKAELEKKKKIEKAKKLKLQSVRSSNVSAKITNPDAALEKIVADFYS